MNKKTAFITGATGQDGCYLADLLLSEGYEVILGVRRVASDTTWRLKDIGVYDKVKFQLFDLSEPENIYKTIREGQFDEFYNLGAMSFVGSSFNQPVLTQAINGTAVLHILEAIKNYSPNTKFYQASTSEMYGKVRETPQNEETYFHPRSPYGISKLYAYWMTRHYREAYGLYTSNGILFNHESRYRGNEFVTQKIVKAVKEQMAGGRDLLKLGNLEAKRDWGHSKDYVKGMYLMLQQEEGDDYVLATGKTTTVRAFVEKVYLCYGIEIEWAGEGIFEVGFDNKTGRQLVNISEEFYRPAEVDLLLGDPTKAKEKLGWTPEMTLDDLIKDMVEA
jgi:GDPmannose 4,6-dehydratase